MIAHTVHMITERDVIDPAMDVMSNSSCEHKQIAAQVVSMISGRWNHGNSILVEDHPPTSLL
jgi:hypothetical protein